MVAVIENKIVPWLERVDRDFNRTPGQRLEADHARAAGENLYVAGHGFLMAGAMAINGARIFVSTPFAIAAGAARNLAKAGKYAAAKALLSTTIDEEAKKVSDPAMQSVVQELSEKIKASIDAIPEESYNRFEEGLVSLPFGLGASMFQTAQALKDAGDTLVHAGAAAAVGGARGFVYAAGKAVSGIGYAVSSAFESAFRRLKAFFARLEARADVVQQGSIDLWKKTNELYAKKEA